MIRRLSDDEHEKLYASSIEPVVARSMVDVGGGKMLPNPNGFSYDSAGNLIGPIKGGGSGGFSFLGDIGDWFGNLFGSGAGGAAGGGLGDLAGGAGGFFP